MIYFDNAATSYYKPKIVKDAVGRALNIYTANPGRSGHKPAQDVAIKCFEAREDIKEFFGAKNYNLVFTKNCTEALNLGISGIVDSGDHVITTCYEHNSVLRTLKFLEQQRNIELSIVDCDAKELIIEIEKNIRPNTRLVVTTHCSNVIGEIIDISSISDVCKKHDILYIVDGAQSSGHIDIDLNNAGIDMFAFAGHKGLMSITGVGGLFIKEGISLKPLIYGGTGTDSESIIQPADFPEGYESGTIPTIPIISLQAGVQFLKNRIKSIERREKKLSEYIFNKLKELKFLDCYFNKNSRNVFTFNIKDIDSSTIANILNEQFGLCVRPGLHCAPLIHQKLGTLQQGAVRVSIDFNNTEAEINKLISALKQINLMKPKKY